LWQLFGFALGLQINLWCFDAVVLVAVEASGLQKFCSDSHQLKGSVKELNKFHICETEKITHKASDVAEYIELFGSFTRDRHARRI